MSWVYKGKIFDESQIGDATSFVYLIRNVEEDKSYIGKKNFTKRVTKAPLKGKKRKRRSVVPSDWQTYYGSNEELAADVERLGTGAFEREILRLCYSKGEATYYEAKYQFTYDAIISDKYYNKWIYVRVRKDHLKKAG